MTRKGRIIQKLIVIAIILLGIGVFAKGILRSFAAFSSDDLPYVTRDADSIPSGNIIIGTYIIDLYGLDDTIYSKATEAGNKYSQNNMYYKSELGDDKWYWLDTINDLSGITQSGVPVDKGVISDLKFTHQVSAAGVITDLVNSRTVSKYNDPSIYDARNLREWDSFFGQLDLLGKRVEEKTATPNATWHLEQLNNTVSQHNDVLNNAAAQLSSGDNFYTLVATGEYYMADLPGRGKSTKWVDAVDEVLASIDANRRSIVYQADADILNDLVQVISNGAHVDKHKTNVQVGTDGDGNPKYEEQEIPEMNVDPMSDVLEAITGSMQELEKSAGEYRGKIISEGDTAFSITKYKYVESLINALTIGNIPDADKSTEKLVNIKDISSDTITDAAAELEVIGEMDSLSETMIKEAISAGACQAFYDATSDVGRTGALDNQKASIQDKFSELENIINMALDRKTTEEGQDLLLSKISEIDSLKSMVKGDAAKDRIIGAIDEYKDWLIKKYGDQSDKKAAQNGEKTLADQLAEAETNKQQALDNNDSALAEEYAAKCDELQKQIEEQDLGLLDVINDPNASNIEKTKARANLSDNGAAKAAMDLADKIKEALADSQNSGARPSVGTAPDGSESGGKKSDTTPADSTSTDSTPTDSTEADSASTDSTATDSTATDSTSTDSTASDSTATDSTAADSTDTDASKTQKKSDDAAVTDLDNVKEDKDSASKPASAEEISAEGKIAVQALSDMADTSPKVVAAVSQNLEDAVKSAEAQGKKVDQLKSQIGEIKKKAQDNIASKGNLSSNDILDIEYEYFKKPHSEYTFNDQIIDMIACDIAYRATDNEEFHIKAQRQLIDIYSFNHRKVYLKLKGTQTEYILISCLCGALDCRYIYDGAKQECTILDHDKIYELTVGSRTVTTRDGDISIAEAPVYEKGVYLRADIVKEWFDIECYYFKKSDYAILTDSETMKQAKELSNRFLE